MKNAKKLMALILGVIMAMGCLSVSAANNDLTVTENPAKIIFADDFSDNTLNTEHIVPGEATVQSDGVLGAYPTPAGAFATIYAAREGVTEIVNFEYDLSWSNLANYSSAQFQMLFKNENNATVADIRLYGGAYKFGIISSNTTTAPYKYVDYTGINKAHVKVRFNPATKGYTLWLDGVEALSEADGVKYARNSFTAMTAVSMSMANCSVGSVSIDNFKIYTEEVNGIPAIWEEISREDFETDVEPAASQGKVSLNASGINYTWKNGLLKTTSVTPGNNSWSYSLTDENGSKLTGKYLVELRLSNDGTDGNNRHRVNFFGTMFVGWTAKSGYNGIYVHNSSADKGVKFSDNAQFNASKAIKVTALVNVENDTIDFWFNDVYAFQHQSAAGAFAKLTAENSFVKLNPYGTVCLDYVRVYRPLEIDENTGIKIEEKGNKVKFAVNNEKSGNIYFAKYDADGTSKSLASIATSGINFVPGNIYTVDKTEWNGAKAFLWDENLAPIVDPWNLSQAE